LFKDWDGVTPFDEDKVPSFIYAEMTEESGNCMSKMDEEMLKINAALRKLFPDDKHLQENYSMQHNVLLNYKDQVPARINTRTKTRLQRKQDQAKIKFELLKHTFMCLRDR
jgi:hypothetical protein